MNILEARRRLLDGEIKKRTAEGENISVRSVSRMRPALTLYGKSEQETTTGAQLNNKNISNLLGTIEGTIISSLHNASIIIPIQGGEDYTISYQGGGKAITFHCTTEEYPAEGIEIVDTYMGSSGIEVSEKIMHTSSQARYLIINVSINFAELLKNAMINSGSTALPWEPYTGGAPSPSPDYPQEIKSAGDSGTINISLSDGGSQSQILPVQTPNGLPGIPVSSGGNYTGANGQQWVCDEVDFKREVYVQRVKTVNAREVSWGDAWNTIFPDESGNTHVFNTNVGATNRFFKESGLSACFKWGRINNPSYGYNVFSTRQGDGDIGVRVSSDLASTIEEWNAYINSHDIIFVLGMQEENYVETPLSASELSAYAALRTYSPTTVVSNDAGAWMKLGYKTKKSLEVTD